MQQTPLYQRLDFLRESIRNLRLTGSVAPSSQFLCRAIVAKINPEKAAVVVELGPGDGVITRYILERLHPDARLVIFEINEIFVEKIRATFDDPRLLVIHDSAEHIGRHFKALNVEKADYIVSGIPFVVLPESLTRRITLECRRWLRAEGRFIQFHYSPLLIPFYRRVFGNVEVELVPLNIPPAIIISCEKKE
ncbi:MAG: methyltransferase domain-containing protein [Saprospiraceae bacterium]|nr:methyltransferase domain-containing protein [Saprospiraceae bacterium]